MALHLFCDSCSVVSAETIEEAVDIVKAEGLEALIAAFEQWPDERRVTIREAGPDGEDVTMSAAEWARAKSRQYVCGIENP
jgi:hypothetical protein